MEIRARSRLRHGDIRLMKGAESLRPTATSNKKKGAHGGNTVSPMLFGAHVSSSGGIHKTLDRAGEMGADCVQLFTQSPRMWRPTNHDPANFETFKKRRTELGIPSGGVVAHALYLCNLAAPDDEIYGKSRAALRNTMEVACEIEADGVVFHVGSHLGAGMDVGMERCVPALREALELC